MCPGPASIGDSTYITRVLKSSKIEDEHTTLICRDCNERLPAKSRQPTGDVAQEPLTRWRCELVEGELLIEDVDLR